MTLDSLSYTSTSRLRALLCPIGRIRRTRFLEFVERVQLENIVRLGDVSPDLKPNRSTFTRSILWKEKLVRLAGRG